MPRDEDTLAPTHAHCHHMISTAKRENITKRKAKLNQSVLVVLDVEALGRSLTQRTAALVGSEGCLGVGLAPLEEHSLGLLHILCLALPCLEGTCLKSPSKGECEGPWLLSLELVHGIQVEGGLLLALEGGAPRLPNGIWL